MSLPIGDGCDLSPVLELFELRNSEPPPDKIAAAVQCAVKAVENALVDLARIASALEQIADRDGTSQ